MRIPPPLNGTKTHPLSAHALDVLRDLLGGLAPCSTVNAGVINRLQRGCLVELVDLPSPFKSHRGAAIPHLRITDAGRAALAQASC